MLRLYSYYGDEFTIECPTGSGRQGTLLDVANELADRMTNLFLHDADGRRPVHGDARQFREDPHWRDLVLFYEYFHGDDGKGIGASHQTGWTGCIARMMQGRAVLTKELLLGPEAQHAAMQRATAKIGSRKQERAPV